MNRILLAVIPAAGSLAATLRLRQLACLTRSHWPMRWLAGLFERLCRAAAVYCPAGTSRRSRCTVATAGVSSCYVARCVPPGPVYRPAPVYVSPATLVYRPAAGPPAPICRPAPVYRRY